MIAGIEQYRHAIADRLSIDQRTVNAAHITYYRAAVGAAENFGMPSADVTSINPDSAFPATPDQER
jgi:hypothetical protein